jgi:hypothetical protein
MNVLRNPTIAPIRDASSQHPQIGSATGDQSRTSYSRKNTINACGLRTSFQTCRLQFNVFDRFRHISFIFMTDGGTP